MTLDPLREDFADVRGETRAAVAGASAVPNLIVTSELHGDKVFPLDKPVTTIGRSIDHDVILIDRKVSNCHAEIHRQGPVFVIRDLGSTNGTFVNGIQIAEAVLSLGDEVTLGSTLLVFTNKTSYEKTAKLVLGTDFPGTPQTPLHGLPGRTLEIPLVDIEKRFFQSLDDGRGPLDVAHKLNILYRLSSSINSILEVDELLERVMDLILEVISCDRAFIILCDKDNRLVPKVIRKKAGVKDHKGLSVSATIISQVLREGKAIVTRDAQDDERFHGGQSIVFYSIRAAISMPLKAKDQIVGVVHLDRVTAAQPFKDEDIQLLALICNQAAVNLANAKLFEDVKLANQELKQAKEEILRWNMELEAKVDERTHEIAKQNEEILRLNEQKDELMGMVAHDLRTPISSILGFSEVILQHLEMSADPEKLREDVRIVGRIAGEMTDLLNDLLDVSKIESGKITIQRERRPIQPLVMESYHTYLFLGEAKKLKIQLDMEEDLFPVLHDPQRIGQVLNNLLHNAMKFSRAEDNVTLGAHRVGDSIELSVADTGQGIAPEDLPRVFGRFEQGSSQATCGEYGSGLGLAIAKKLVELHGGRIWVDSKKGVGTKFTFSLPLD